MTDDARLLKGIEMCKQAYGSVLPAPDPQKLTPFSENTLKNLFGEIYARDKINMRDRRLLILGAIAGLGADPSLFEIHARAALGNHEIEPDELEEFCLILVNYCGYPKVSPLWQICRKILDEKS